MSGFCCTFLYNYNGIILFAIRNAFFQKSEEQKLFHKLRAKQLGGPEVYPSAGVCPTPSQCMKSENANDSELETLKVKVCYYCVIYLVSSG